MFAKVENGVTKSCQNFRRKNRKNTGPGGSHGGGYTGQHVGGRSGASGVSELIALATVGRLLLVPVAPGPPVIHNEVLEILLMEVSLTCRSRRHSPRSLRSPRSIPACATDTSGCQ